MKAVSFHMISYENMDKMGLMMEALDQVIDDGMTDAFRNQILPFDPTSITNDLFESVLNTRNEVKNAGGIDDDSIIELDEEINELCLKIIGYINEAQHTSIDFEELHRSGGLTVFTYTIYKFFVLNIFAEIRAIIITYIVKHLDELAEAFDGITESRDANTTENMKFMDSRYAIIASDPFSVIDYVFSMIDSETIFEWLKITDDTDTHIPLVKKYVTDGLIGGNFVRVWADAFKDNLAFRSKLALNVIYAIRDMQPNANPYANINSSVEK